MRTITTYRLNHRIFRDQRITSHVALTARAFGAKGFIYSGEQDLKMEQSVTDVIERWGGKFEISYSETVKTPITSHFGIVIHLTMYGESHFETLNTLSNYSDKDLLLIVGGPKVPPYIYELADFNTAISWQPHSEVSAIAVFLYELMEETGELYKSYPGAKMKLDGTGKKSYRSEKYRNL